MWDPPSSQATMPTTPDKAAAASESRNPFAVSKPGSNVSDSAFTTPSRGLPPLASLPSSDSIEAPAQAPAQVQVMQECSKGTIGMGWLLLYIVPYTTHVRKRHSMTADRPRCTAQIESCSKHQGEPHALVVPVEQLWRCLKKRWLSRRRVAQRGREGQVWTPTRRAVMLPQAHWQSLPIKAWLLPMHHCQVIPTLGTR